MKEQRVKRQRKTKKIKFSSKTKFGKGSFVNGVRQKI